MDGESGESTEEDDVTDVRRGESETETGMRLRERSRELVSETR